MGEKQTSQPLYTSDAVPPCEHCGKKLKDANARWQHLKHKHGLGVRKGNLKPLPEREPSMAELHVAFLMGDDNAYEPWMEGCDNERIG